MSEEHKPKRGAALPIANTDELPFETGRVRVQGAGGEGGIDLGSELEDELQHIQVPPAADPQVQMAIGKLKEGTKEGLSASDHDDLGVAYMGMGLVDEAVHEFNQASKPAKKKAAKAKKPSAKKATPKAAKKVAKKAGKKPAKKAAKKAVKKPGKSKAKKPAKKKSRRGKMDSLDWLIELALDEDLGAAGDITTRALVPPGVMGRAELWAKETLVLSGSRAFARVFSTVDSSSQTQFDAKEANRWSPRARWPRWWGRSLRSSSRNARAEYPPTHLRHRHARPSGRGHRGGNEAADFGHAQDVARMRSFPRTRCATAAPPTIASVSLTACRSRTTTSRRWAAPSPRRCAAPGSTAPRLVKVEIEVDSLEQLREAVGQGADLVLLDNMTDAQISEAVAFTQGRAVLESFRGRHLGTAVEAGSAWGGLCVPGGPDALGSLGGPVAGYYADAVGWGAGAARRRRLKKCRPPSSRCTINAAWR